jgi:hypothetical protein
MSTLEANAYKLPANWEKKKKKRRKIELAHSLDEDTRVVF